MNYERIRKKLKEKQDVLRSLKGSEKQRAEQLIIDQVNAEQMSIDGKEIVETKTGKVVSVEEAAEKVGVKLSKKKSK